MEFQNVNSKMIEVESNFNPKTVSHAGAMGLMQLMPANVKEMGVKNPFHQLKVLKVA